MLFSPQPFWIIHICAISQASQVAVVVKHPPANAGDVRDGLNPWVQEIPGEGHGNPLLAWRIPWTEEPSGLQSIGSQRVGEDWNALAGKCALHSFLARPSIWCWNFHLLPFSLHLKYILKNLILNKTYLMNSLSVGLSGKKMSILLSFKQLIFIDLRIEVAVYFFSAHWRYCCPVSWLPQKFFSTQLATWLNWSLESKLSFFFLLLLLTLILCIWSYFHYAIFDVIFLCLSDLNHNFKSVNWCFSGRFSTII